MLPQPLVQNKLISNPKNTSFQLDWNLAAPILNLNFFHTEKLVAEQNKYRHILAPWEEVEVDNINYLGTHEYCYSKTKTSKGALKIYVGTLVGRLHYTLSNPGRDFVAVTPTLTKFYIKDYSYNWTVTYDPNHPAIVRAPAANLLEPTQIKLKDWLLNNGIRSYTYVDNTITQWYMSVGYSTSVNTHPVLRRSNDVIFGRILWNSQCIATIPIQINQQYSVETGILSLILSFTDQNFPSDATVELY